jgi:hypothetical protein
MITVEELNSLMSTLYLSDELAEIKWDDTTPSDNDKQVLLNKALKRINALQFDGYKVSQDQQNEFPRVICREVVQTPEDVKEAICRLVYEFRNNTTSQRKKLQRDGVKSINTGGVSETYVDGLESKGSISKEVKQLLNNWLYRGV